MGRGGGPSPASNRELASNFLPRPEEHPPVDFRGFTRLRWGCPAKSCQPPFLVAGVWTPGPQERPIGITPKGSAAGAAARVLPAPEGGEPGDDVAGHPPGGSAAPAGHVHRPLQGAAPATSLTFGRFQNRAVQSEAFIFLNLFSKVLRFSSPLVRLEFSKFRLPTTLKFAFSTVRRNNLFVTHHPQNQSQWTG